MRRTRWTLDSCSRSPRTEAWRICRWGLHAWARGLPAAYVRPRAAVGECSYFSFSITCIPVIRAIRRASVRVTSRPGRDSFVAMASRWTITSESKRTAVCTVGPLSFDVFVLPISAYPFVVKGNPHASHSTSFAICGSAKGRPTREVIPSRTHSAVTARSDRPVSRNERT